MCTCIYIYIYMCIHMAGYTHNNSSPNQVLQVGDPGLFEVHVGPKSLTTTQSFQKSLTKVDA